VKTGALIAAFLATFLFLKVTRAHAIEYQCGTVEAVVAQVSVHPVYLSHAVLNGSETARALRAIDPNAPDESKIDTGVMILRTDKSIIFVVFQSDGACGKLIVSPENVERMLRAIRGTVS